MTQESAQTLDARVVSAGVTGLTTSATPQRVGCLELAFDGGSVTHRAVEIAH